MSQVPQGPPSARPAPGMAAFEDQQHRDRACSLRAGLCTVRVLTCLGLSFPSRATEIMVVRHQWGC